MNSGWRSSARALSGKVCSGFPTRSCSMKTCYRSVQLDMGVLHHLAPALGLILDEVGEFCRRGRVAINVELLKTLLDLGRGDRVVDRTVELVHDVRRRAVRHEYPV